MAFYRRIGVISILGACFFAAAGCGDDDDKKTSDADAGEGGDSAGSAGKGQGGSTSNAGKGGTAGGGSAGKAGSSSVGGAGEGGASGGSGAGAGGELPIAGEGGAAGSSGAAGAAGAGGVPSVLTKCATSCQVDDDCKVGEDTTQKCDVATHRCIDPSLSCEVNDDCVPATALWSPCGIDAGCDEGLLCITWQGSGFCAYTPIPDFGCGLDSTMSLPLFGAQGNGEVCVPANSRCNSAGQCFLGCGAFGCEDGVCNEVTGVCGCSTDDECFKNKCLPDSTCAECATDDDCATNEFGNKVCVNGKCGCGSVETCPPSPYVNAPAVCE